MQDELRNELNRELDILFNSSYAPSIRMIEAILRIVRSTNITMDCVKSMQRQLPKQNPDWSRIDIMTMGLLKVAQEIEEIRRDSK